jgi:Ca-activated chloride channel family protein
VKVDIDEEMLSEVALITGGKYFRATDTLSLQSVYETIDELETTTFSAPQYQDYLELYPWCVVLAVCLIALEQILDNTVLRKLP